MRQELAAIVCCPVHKSKLKLSVAKADGDDIMEGTLTCGVCRFDYPIEEGIPNLLPPEYHTDEVREKKPKSAPPAKPAKGSATKAKGSK